MTIIEVVGTNYTNAEQILKNVIKDKGEIWNSNGYQEHAIELTLSPEPENIYDKNAISVISEYPTPENAKINRSGKLGYLPRNSDYLIENDVIVPAIVKEGFGKFWIKIDKIHLKEYLRTDFEDDCTEDYDKFIDELAEELEYEQLHSNPLTHNRKRTVNKFIFALLAIFLGFFGCQWFYAKNYKKGALYLLFSWTFIPFLLSLYQGIKALASKTDSSFNIRV